MNMGMVFRALVVASLTVAFSTQSPAIANETCQDRCG